MQENPNINSEKYMEQIPYGQEAVGTPPQIMPYTGEEEITNIVSQIDPVHIVDNLNHSLKGEIFIKEKGIWEKIGQELVNESCRGWIVSYLVGLMNNASTMGIIQEQQLNFLMEGVIKSVTREFRCNLEKFGFVPPGEGYSKGEYENRGTPDTSRMESVAEMIYQRAFLIFSRSLKGTESSKIFQRLSMNDSMMYGGQEQKQHSIFPKFMR